MLGRVFGGLGFGLRGLRLGMRGMRRGMRKKRNCVCPKCGYTQEHTPGTPCHKVSCPSCGSQMRREQS